MNLKYRNAGLTAAIGNPVINYAEGNCAGGGSEINSGLFHEIPDSTLLGWEKKPSFLNKESGGFSFTWDKGEYEALDRVAVQKNCIVY